MAKRRIKVIWGGADEIPGEWKFGVWGYCKRGPGSRAKGLVLSVSGLLRVVGVCALGCYLAGAAALYVWFANQPHNRVTLIDTLLMPVRWTQVRELRGQMMIETGLDDLKAHRWAEASMRLTTGLARAPHHPVARLKLAQFLVMANRRPEALKVLTADLAHGFPGRRYLEVLFQIANEGEDFDVVVETCERFATVAEDAAWRRVQLLQAFVAAGRAEEAVKLIDAVEGTPEATLREMRVLALLELKRAPEAVAYLQQWRKIPGGSLAQVVRLEVRAFREAGDLAGMGRALAEFRQVVPGDPRTYAYGIVQEALAQQTEAASAELDGYFLRFAGNQQNILLLATALAEAKVPALVQRCREVSATHGFPSLPVDLALLQAQVAAGDWAGAERTMTAVQAKIDVSNPGEVFLGEWMGALVAASAHPDEGLQAVLIGLLQQRPMPMRVYRVTVGALVRAQRLATAQRVLELSERVYPGSRTLAALRQQVETELRPAAPVGPTEAAPAAKGGTERTFFVELNQAQTDGRWTDAAQAIRAVLVRRPAWLETRESDVREWQMRVAARTEDIPELLQATSAYLDGSTGRALKAFDIARQLEARKRRDDAERVLREILRKNPEFPAATKLLEQWQQAKLKP